MSKPRQSQDLPVGMGVSCTQTSTNTGEMRGMRDWGEWITKGVGVIRVSCYTSVTLLEDGRMRLRLYGQQHVNKGGGHICKTARWPHGAGGHLGCCRLEARCATRRMTTTAGATECDIDNSACVNMAEDYASSNRTRHIARRHMRVREATHRGIMRVRLVASADNIADFSTKVLEKFLFQKHRRVIMNLVARAGGRVGQVVAAYAGRG